MAGLRAVRHCLVAVCKRVLPHSSLLVGEVVAMGQLNCAAEWDSLKPVASGAVIHTVKRGQIKNSLMSPRGNSRVCSGN